MPQQQPANLSDQVRVAVDASGMSHSAISAEIGLSRAQMSRFMSGQLGLSMAALDRLGKLLGLSIVAPGEQSRGGGRGSVRRARR